MGMKRDSAAKSAAALKWDPSRDEAPRLIAAGKGPLADRILALAEEGDVPIVEKEPLADALLSLEPGQSIPPELFRLAAEVYIFLKELDGSGNPGGTDHPGQDSGKDPVQE
jgi:flagellar biosynthesis protein